MFEVTIGRRLLGCIAVLTLIASAAQAQERTLKFAFSLSKDHPMGYGAQRFADLVAQKSGGKIRVNIFANAVLGSDPQNLSAVRGGTLDFTTMATGLLAGLNKEFMVFDLPFMFRDHQEAYDLSDGPVGKMLLGKLSEHGVIGLGIWDLGFRNITNSRRPWRAEPGLALCVQLPSPRYGGRSDIFALIVYEVFSGIS